MYQDVVSIDKISYKLGLVVFSVDVDIYEAYTYAQENTQMPFLVEAAGNILRSKVMALKNSYASLPYPLHASDTTAPDIVTDFFQSSLHRVIIFGTK